MDSETRHLFIKEIQAYRREVNNFVFIAVKDEEQPKNVEDAVRLLGNLNAAFEHEDSSDSGDSLFCILKHLATAMVQAEEVFEKSEKITRLISIATNNKILPCSSCKEEIKEEYDGIQTA